MTKTPIVTDEYIDAMSALLDLPIAPEHRDGVRTFLAVAATMAAKLDEAPAPPSEYALAPVVQLPDADE